ncbi:energy-coupling factor transporter transmembrane component T family protein [Paenibacillus protaetiae]|uniref:Energy-coupling factor transporter transmembrane protein EcfT n=1 Tax=Paenibacillus protaetiae TaxID=2509456 RepID=A0A4P6EVE1_9BACL|nr:energy-coupling factor transporter transmembrane component T [Paenibacillus protaetiae]QAY66964.1 energy-coupling factor transporter transmembrane protein EcfT [Paenibacillus protaetiae]
MNVKMLAYTPLDTPIHRLAGASKLLFFIIWSVTAMITYDTRVLAVMLAFSLVVLALSRVRFADYSFVLGLILFFFLLNHIAIFLFSPQEGVHIYGTRHELLPIYGRYAVTEEQLFYQLNIVLKYGVVIPMALLFLLTTHPSEFAASLNRVGISYRIAFAVAIAMRYIPDVQRDFQNISFSAQARGIDISGKERLLKRLRNVISILMPLILTSMGRIESVSAAMELRGFGEKRRRTWYSARPFRAGDIAATAFIVLFAAGAAWLTFRDGSRFYNPFQR